MGCYLSHINGRPKDRRPPRTLSVEIGKRGGPTKRRSEYDHVSYRERARSYLGGIKFHYAITCEAAVTAPEPGERRTLRHAERNRADLRYMCD